MQKAGLAKDVPDPPPSPKKEDVGSYPKVPFEAPAKGKVVEKGNKRV